MENSKIISNERLAKAITASIFHKNRKVATGYVFGDEGHVNLFSRIAGTVVNVVGAGTVVNVVGAGTVVNVVGAGAGADTTETYVQSHNSIIVQTDGSPVYDSGNEQESFELSIDGLTKALSFFNSKINSPIVIY